MVQSFLLIFLDFHRVLWKMLWESLPDKSYQYLAQFVYALCFFADSLLIVSYVLGALQKELHIAPFIERFKTVALEKSYW